MLYTTALDVWAEASLTAAGRAILDDATAAAQATTLGLGTADTPQFAGLGIGVAGVTGRVRLNATAYLSGETAGLVQAVGNGAGYTAFGVLAEATGYGAIGFQSTLGVANYAIASSASDSNLYINAPTSKTINFKINNSASIVFIDVDSLTLAATKKLRLDGAATGDTYLSESSANIVDLYAGGINQLKATATALTLFGGAAGVDYTLTLNGETNDLVATWYEDEAILGLAAADVMLASGKKLILDGSLTGDTWIDESAANVLKLSAGGSEATLSAGQFTIPTAFAVGANVGVTATYVVGLADLPVTIVVVGGLVISIG